jgi:hypothetical protein
LSTFVVGVDRLGDLAADRVIGVQARQRILEDHADARPAQHLQIAARQGEEIASLEPHLSRNVGTGQQADDRLGEHALARAGLSGDAEQLPGFDRERNVLQSMDGAVLGRNADAEMPDVKNWQAIRSVMHKGWARDVARARMFATGA